MICHSQLQVKGSIFDEKGEALPYASIMLLNSKDSSLVRGQVSNAEGFYSIDVLDAGEYFISITAIGFQEVLSKLFSLNKSNSPLDLGKLIAPEKVEELSEVVIKGEKPFFEQKIDRTIINVQSQISRAGGTALDVLQRSPGVTVDRMNNAIALSGKQGVRIMINGRLSRLPMDAVVQMLAGTNAENIERIELITTPPSKYEAEGDAGMINIVMKQSEDMGTNGNLSLFSGFGRRGKYGGTLNMNYRNRSFNIFGDLALRNNFSREDWNTGWEIPINNELHKTISNNDRNNFTGVKSGSIGIDWSIGKKTNLGALVNVFDRRWDMDALADITQYVDHSRSGKILMKTSEENDWIQLLGNINFTHQIDDRFTLSIDLDKIDYESENPTNYFQNYFDANNNFLRTGQLRSRKDTGIKIWTSKVDISGNLSDKIYFEAGAKESYTRLRNDIIVDNLEDEIWIDDDELTVFANMYENILAGYSSATFKASAKLELQAGLRYEHTRTNLDTRSEQNLVDRNYGNWFPSAFLIHKINDKNSWVSSYSRRIARPSFFQLAPFVIFNDPNNFYSGNVSLLPSFTDALKLEYRHKSILMSLQYSYDKNSITLFQPRITKDNKQVSTAENLDYSKNYSFVLSFPIQITPWWEIQLNNIFSMSEIKAIYLGDPKTFSIMNFSLNGAQKFKISKSITAELSGFYLSRQYFGILEMAAVGALDFGIEKKFSNSNLRLSYSDIFKTNRYKLTSDIPSENLNTRIYLDFETSIVTITYARNFGNNKLRAKKSNKTGSIEEQNRLRQ